MTTVNLPQELLDFYEALDKILSESTTKVSLPQIEITEAILKKHYSEGVPLSELAPVAIEKNLCEKIFQEVCSLLENNRPQITEKVKGFKEGSKEKITTLVQSYIKGDEKLIGALVEETQLKGSTISFLLECTAKPFMRAYAQLVGASTDNEEWQKNYCPVCGNKAKHASLDKEDHKRFLQCNMCDHQWLFKRLACPNCSNEDHESLRTLMIEETPQYQIHVCEQCKTYLKVIDGQKKVKAGYKDASTVFLDIIAQQQGYKSDYCAS